MTFAYSIEMKESEILSVEDFLKKYVDVEKFLGYCRECPNYNTGWGCPPYDFDPLDYWKEYRALKVIGKKLIFDEKDVGSVLDKEEWLAFYKEAMSKERDALHRLLKKEEKQNEGSVLLHTGGGCPVCKGGCNREEGSCRHPENLRYSIESLGGNVAAVTTDILGFELCWIEEGKLPAYLCLVGGMLYR